MATGAYWLPLWKRQVYYMCARDRPIKTYKSTDKVGSQSIYTTPVKFKKKNNKKTLLMLFRVKCTCITRFMSLLIVFPLPRKSF